MAAAIPLLTRQIRMAAFYVIIVLSIVIAHGIGDHQNHETTTTHHGLNQSLSNYIWDSSTYLLKEVYKSTFIKGVINGDMDPNFYGAYIMQDAAWCKEVSKVWAKVARDVSTPKELQDYALHEEKGYLECSQSLLKAYNIKDDGVIIEPAATSYANVVRYATEKYGSPYIVIATYACTKLWSNITADLALIVNSSNPYSLWVYNNTGNSSAIKQGNFMDTWAKWYDRSLALSIFHQAMIGEINLFNLWPKTKSHNSYPSCTLPQ